MHDLDFLAWSIRPSAPRSILSLIVPWKMADSWETRDLSSDVHLF